MTFKTIARKRDDGDFDVIAAIQVSGLQDELNYIPNDWANEIIEYMNKCAPNEQFVVLELENVADVIEGDLIGITEQLKPVKALWDYQLRATCPHCEENIELTDCEAVQGYVLQEACGVDVECPECGRDFKIDMVM